MKKRTIVLVLSFMLISSFLTPLTFAQTVETLDNGVISVKFNEAGFPMITSMYINGTRIVPHIHAGADFQMTVRSARGDSYNTNAGR